MSVEIKQLEHIYGKNTPFPYIALKDINLAIKEGSYTAIIGHTGSGKSTLVQHLNALLLPTAGTILIDQFEIHAKQKIKELKKLRKKVGLVFQFPEYQLFEETIQKDIAFGPKNFGVEEAEANTIAQQMLEYVGLDASYLERSPFELSGGQKRRVAIAGILALNPDILVLDEPTAGLDPQGAKEMMELFQRLNRDLNKTIIMVTHDMEHVLNYCEDVIVLQQGEVKAQMSVSHFFNDCELLSSLQIQPPKIVQLKQLLQAKGISINDDIFDLSALALAIKEEIYG